MNSTNENDEVFFEIDLGRIIAALINRINIIIAFAVTFGLSAFLISNFVITPKYVASVSMCVNNNNAIATDSLNLNDINAGIAIIPTYIELLQSNSVLGEVAARTQDLGYDAKDIYDMISVSTVEETQIVIVSVVNTNPEHANVIANAIGKIAPDKISEYMEGVSIKIVDTSVLPEAPSSPNVKRYTVLGILFGLFISMAIIIISELLDRTIKSESDVISLYDDIPILGLIPEFTASDYGEDNSAANTL